MRFSLSSLLLLSLASQAFPQTACPSAVTVNSYRVETIPNAFSTIATAAGVTTFFDATGGPFTTVASSATALPIPFQFFGMAKTNYIVSSNGFLVFTGGTGQVHSQNSHPADGQQPNDWVAPWWDEHVGTPAGCAAPGKVLALYPAPDGSLTLEWNSLQLLVTTSTGIGCYSFQAKIFPSNHPTKPNEIEFHYDLSNPPLRANPCTPVAGWASHLALSATIGLENAFGNVGVDATERGAGNEVFPPCGFRFVPASFRSRDTASGAYYATSTPPAAGFCHIEGLPGTTEFVGSSGGPSCGVCMDNDGTARLHGSLFDLPWKFTLYGRPYKTAEVSPNGWMALGLGWFTSANTPAFGSSDPDAVVAPLWGAWEGIAPSDVCGAPQSSFFWRVDGLAGARTLTIEWHDVHDALGAAADCIAGSQHCSFQARFYEASAGSFSCAPAGCGPGTPVVTTGAGDDRIEFQWDSVCDLFAIATIENWNGTLSETTFPTPGGRFAFDPCDAGTTRYFGDANATPGIAGLCLPEIKANGALPLVGNPFGLSILGGTPGGLTFLLLDATPVPPGGIALPFGTLWASLPPIVLLSAGPLPGAGACQGSRTVALPIPATATLVGAILYAQFAVVVLGVGPLNFGLELTEGAKITIGG